MNSTLLIIPAYNEAENIERVVDNLIENYPQFDYVVINDGSRLVHVYEHLGRVNC